MKKIFKVTKNTLIAEFARIVYLFTVYFHRRKIWIICETELQAQENGYELYQWISKNIDIIDIYYVLDKKSPAINKFDGDGNLLIFNSFKQILYMYYAEKIISTHGLWLIPNELGILKKLTMKTLKAKRVMLNHGIGFLKNGKKFYHKDIFPLNDLIIAISQKHKNIFTKEYGYADSEVAIAGYPRFDTLEDRSDSSKLNNLILFIPTFRDNEQGLGCEFVKTELYLRIKNFIEDPAIQDCIHKTKSNIGIYLHQNIQNCSPYLDFLASKRVHIFKQGDYTVTELLQLGRLLITDYSSVFFDFVYMDKPFISYQFDADVFLSSRKDKPLINIKTDLPGYIVTSHEDLVSRVCDISSSGFKISDIHREQASEYFEYQDKNNCSRVYSTILDLS